MALGVAYLAMATAHAASEDIQAYSSAITTLKLAEIPVCPSGAILLSDVSTCVPRPLVPLATVNVELADNRRMVDHLMVRKTDRCLVKDVKVI